jgi:hypothetical protein
MAPPDIKIRTNCSHCNCMYYDCIMIFSFLYDNATIIIIIIIIIII